VIAAAQQIAQIGFEDGEINEKQAAVEKIVSGLAPDKNAGGLVPLRDVLGAAYDEIAARTGEMLGVKTGFIDYDNLLGGLQKSDLIIIAGRPSMGKTALMMGMASYAARSHNVAFFSLEMSSRQLAHRLIASNTGIDSKRLRLHKLQDGDWSVLISAVSSLGDSGLWIDDTSNCTISHIRTQARKLAARVRLDAIYIDYLQLMNTGRGGRETQIEKITMLSAACKNLARELDIPVAVGSQLSRACEQRNDKRPMLSDLRDSGTIEQDADIVSFIYRDVVYNPETECQAVAEIITAKHRNGPTGKILLRFDEKRATFQNLETGK
jgi:replicative DNA helicase